MYLYKSTVQRMNSAGFIASKIETRIYEMRYDMINSKTSGIRETLARANITRLKKD